MNEESYYNFYENVFKEGRDGSVGRNAFSQELEWFVSKFNLRDKKILEIGSGGGQLQDVVKDYTGIDVAESVRSFYHKPYFVVKDGGTYPFPNETFDGIFSHATFEHIPDIDKALNEMLRVLKPNGVILFGPAWQVRSWAADGYAVRPYKELSFKGRLIKASILVRNFVLFRAILITPGRISRTLRFIFNKGSFRNLDYKKLKANYEKFWDADSDACNSIDPHAAILWFQAHGCEIVNYHSPLKKFFVRTGPLVIKKLQR